MQDWGLLTEDWSRLINRFFDLPMHTVLIAHASGRSDENDVVSPLLQGKQIVSFSTRIPDLIGYMYTEVKDHEVTRKLLTSSTGTILAKNRGEKLPMTMDNPHLDDVFTKMIGG